MLHLLHGDDDRISFFANPSCAAGSHICKSKNTTIQLSVTILHCTWYSNKPRNFYLQYLYFLCTDVNDFFLIFFTLLIINDLCTCIEYNLTLQLIMYTVHKKQNCPKIPKNTPTWQYRMTQYTVCTINSRNH